MGDNAAPWGIPQPPWPLRVQHQPLVVQPRKKMPPTSANTHHPLDDRLNDPCFFEAPELDDRDTGSLRLPLRDTPH